MVNENDMARMEEDEEVDSYEKMEAEDAARIQDEDVRGAIRAIISHRNEVSLNYCYGYAAVSREMVLHTNEFNTQVLYILNNMTHWRGAVAASVRSTLKSYLKREGK